jgi:hypothetical protein
MFNNNKNLKFSIKCVKKLKTKYNLLKGYSTNMNYKYIIIIHFHLVIFSIILISSNILARKEHVELTHLPTLKLSQKKMFFVPKT